MRHRRTSSMLHRCTRKVIGGRVPTAAIKTPQGDGIQLQLADGLISTPHVARTSRSQLHMHFYSYDLVHVVQHTSLWSYSLGVTSY